MPFSMRYFIHGRWKDFFPGGTNSRFFQVMAKNIFPGGQQ